uniref:Uncharacterized protein n=1 Tax=Tetranychus urticae TaxID=32264 RepID=T1JTX9_TETUR
MISTLTVKLMLILISIVQLSGALIVIFFILSME